ncbi:hypothetical protein KBX63_29710 [Micromonospora sp. U21]|nr:hypothetical protein [Micromonospora sp. U21]MBQ0906106.1 hypothetical protein [Micromonospora sp. U21]
MSTAPGCPDIADTESINPSTGASDGGTAGDLVSGVRYRGFLAVTDCIRGVESWRERDHVRVGRATVSPNVLVVSTRAADAYEHVRSPAGVIPALRIEGQLRPPMMSTSGDGAGHPARLVRQQERRCVRDAVPESLRTNADDRLSLDPLGRVEGGDGVVEGRDVADVCPQLSAISTSGRLRGRPGPGSLTRIASSNAKSCGLSPA